MMSYYSTVLMKTSILFLVSIEFSCKFADDGSADQPVLPRPAAAGGGGGEDGGYVNYVLSAPDQQTVESAAASSRGWHLIK